MIDFTRIKEIRERLAKGETRFAELLVKAPTDLAFLLDTIEAQQQKIEELRCYEAELWERNGN